MVAKKRRVPVVLDTNVFVRSFFSRSKNSASKRVVRLWLLEKKLQLIAASAVVDEYLEIFRDVLDFDDYLVNQWRDRFETDSRVSLVEGSRLLELSRDPDDNHFLTVARAGHAKFLVSNDRDLLDIPATEKRRLPFEIVTPAQLLTILEE
ncbi:MAG: putative toxin-antitoxin system toxin component, PIN family [Gemmataceae bacterium]